MGHRARCELNVGAWAQPTSYGSEGEGTSLKRNMFLSGKKELVLCLSILFLNRVS